MQKIRSFDSFEDMLRPAHADTHQADAQTTGWQRATTVGDYYITVHDDLIIYGQVIDDTADNGPSSANYRTVEAFSQYCPEGEGGYVHVTAFTGLLTVQAFERARALGWPSIGRDLDRILHIDPRWRRTRGGYVFTLEASRS